MCTPMGNSSGSMVTVVPAGAPTSAVAVCCETLSQSTPEVVEALASISTGPSSTEAVTVRVTTAAFGVRSIDSFEGLNRISPRIDNGTA